MPELYRKRPLDETHKLFGKGSEQQVFAKTNETKLIKERLFHDMIEDSREFAGAEFYLTKIAHLLFPDNIPDIHAIHIPIDEVKVKKEDNTNECKDPDEAVKQTHLRRSVHPKIDLSVDPFTDDMRNVVIDDSYTRVFPPNYTREMKPILAKRYQIEKALQSKLKEVGILNIDNSSDNYVIDSTGTAVYIDRITPLYFSQLNKLSIDIDKIRSAIETKIVNPTDKKRAQIYFKRLTKYIEELQRLMAEHNIEGPPS